MSDASAAYLRQLKADISSLEPSRHKVTLLIWAFSSSLALDLGDPPNTQGATNSAPAPADGDGEPPCEYEPF
jgi:hypothetical protein